MARVIAIGQLANESERNAIAHLRDCLPATYTILHNLEIIQGADIFEIDLVILAPHCIFVVDVKGTHGLIDVYGSKWYPEGRQPYHSPLAKLRQHAKTLSNLICDAYPAKPELRRAHVHATVLMTAPEVHVVDYGGIDGNNVTYLNKSLAYFQSNNHIPSHRAGDIRSLLPFVEKAILGKARPKAAQIYYGSWQVEEKLGGDDHYTEYRARHTFTDKSGGTARLRIYSVDPYQNKATRDAERQRISNAFQAVNSIPRHPNVLGVRDLFPTEDEDSLVLVTEDVPGQALRQYIKKSQLALNFDQKLRIMRDVLTALAHAHRHEVLHRNLTPDTILISHDGQARLTAFDYARVGSSRTSTIAHDIVDDLNYAYQAPECYREPIKACIGSDLFSAGLVFYELLTENPAFESAEQIYDQHAIFPIKPSERIADLPSSVDSWLQKLCAFKCEDRFPSADAALQELEAQDLTNLPVNYTLGNRFIIQERLGNPGSFCVAYKVLDTLGDVVRVLKLVTRDRRSVYERLRQEYKTLVLLPEHPHVVKVIWADRLPDETPFIVFEYVDGLDVEKHLEAGAFSLEEAEAIAKQTAAGLSHLHQHGVYHQDIKPSNLLLTDSGVRIIDFNVAVSDQDEMTASAGTRRYLPPDYNLTLLSAAKKIDRDLYALGITFYECVTGRYPFDESTPLGTPRDPRENENCEALSQELVQLLIKAIAPKIAARFSSADQFLEAIAALTTFRKPKEHTQETVKPSLPLVSHLATHSDVGEVEPPKSLSQAQPGNEELKAPPQPATGARSEADGDLNMEVQLTSHNQNQLPTGKSVVLDPTGLYPILVGYTPITTEVEWIRYFFIAECPYWIKGKRLCDWTHEWLRVWNKTDAIIEEKQNPRPRLESLCHPLPLPKEWNDVQVLELIIKLSSYSKENPIPYLLSEVVGSNGNIWLEEPSVNHLAQWLSVQVPEEYRFFERVWQDQISQHSRELAVYYRTEDKLLLLRRWLSLTDSPIQDLGSYPLTIPTFLLKEFDAFWERQIIQDEGKALDKLVPTQQPGMPQIAFQAYKILKARPKWLTGERKTKLDAYLSHQQRHELDDRSPPLQPQSLPIDASHKDTFEWVIESYLPFRRWETAISKFPVGQRSSDQLADSFVEWIRSHYPVLKLEPVQSSILNYNVASLVQDLCKESPVLWVVVDGLGWLDHQELVAFLTKNNKLALATAIQPRFAILPTKTEYAKWSLYTQLLPSDPSWIPDAGKGFPKMGIGKRYTDQKKDQLYQALKKNSHRLYCWDTDKLDHLYHTERDWQNLYQVQRPHVLEGIAKDIEYCVEQYPYPDQLRIVISSDHGQMMGEVKLLGNCPEEIESKGRMAIGTTNDSRFVVLEAERFSLPHTVSIVREAACINALSYTLKKEIIGSHGGLFPEEVVVGLSILRQSVQLHLIIASCRGEGKAKQPGELELIIDNPNSLPLTDLCLYINELPSFNTGKSIDQNIPANEKVFLNISILEWPELSPSHDGNRLALSGELSFRLANTEVVTAKLDSESAIIVNQIFIGGDLDINDFL